MAPLHSRHSWIDASPRTMPSISPPTASLRDRLRRACASLDLAELRGHPYAMSQALAEVARCHRELAAHGSAETHFDAAARWARFAGSPDHLAELLCEAADAAVRLADALDTPGEPSPDAGSVDGSGGLPPAAGAGAQSGGRAAGRSARERARDRAFEVSQLAGRVSDPSCEARLLMRVGELLERCGDHADALKMQLRALDRLGGVAPRDPSLLSGFGRLADG